jgi:hypothetical protein
VSFDGRSITYGIGELDALVPAYGASILAFFESLVGLQLGSLGFARRSPSFFANPSSNSQP